MTTGRVVVRRTKRLQEGHLWVFSNELAHSPKGHAPGETVELYDLKGGYLGTGYINPGSLIAVRILTREKEPVGPEFIRRRLTEAAALRGRFVAGTTAYRLVYSDADYLPGLIVDRYGDRYGGDALVVQFLTAGMEARKEEVLGILDELFSPPLLVIRNDSRARELEGLPLYKEVWKGAEAALPIIEESGALFEVHPWDGQKTGFFLDQRENRTALAGLVKGGTGLDLFSYMGGWGVHLARARAAVTCVDESGKALACGQRNAELNGVSALMRFEEAEVFSFLKAELEKGEARYDFIVLDPPAFVKSARKIKEALKAYGWLNRTCMKLLVPGGLLATSSCSYHVTRADFVAMLAEAAREAGRRPRLIMMGSQAKDHPVLPAMPETEYLKCAFLAVG